jgi:hypothetical protein
MEKILEAQAVKQELLENPPTGRKVMKQAAPDPAPTTGANSTDVPAATLAAAVQEVVENIGTAFIKAQEWNKGHVLDDDGGVEVKPE